MCPSVRLLKRGSVEILPTPFGVLTRPQCFALLATGSVGRIALTDHSLPVILPVLYRVAGDAVVFRVTGRLLETAARQGHVVCFEADCNGIDPLRTWSVLLTGRLSIAPSANDLDASSTWRPDDPGWMVSLTAEFVSGRGSTGRSLGRHGD